MSLSPERLLTPRDWQYITYRQSQSTDDFRDSKERLAESMRYAALADHIEKCHKLLADFVDGCAENGITESTGQEGLSELIGEAKDLLAKVGTPDRHP